MTVVPLLPLLFRPHVPVVMVRVGQGQCAEKSGKVAEGAHVGMSTVILVPCHTYTFTAIRAIHTSCIIHGNHENCTRDHFQVLYKMNCRMGTRYPVHL